MTIDTSREAIDRMTGLWGVGVEPNMARVTEMLAALTRERDEALAREAALREAVMGVETSTEALVRFAAGDVYDIIMDREGVQDRRKSEAFTDAIVRAANALEALTSTATAAEARDAALVERGRREGIEEARMAAYDLARDYAGCDDEAEAVALEKLAFQLKRAIATPPAKETGDA
jgi:hypothetical protein